MEKLHVHTNGQWKLTKNWTQEHKDAALEWSDSGMREHLKDLPPAKGPLRSRMMRALKRDAEHRVTKDGVREYKLYRAAHADDNLHHTDLTSWTHDLGFTKYWNEISKENNPNATFHVREAWIPEHQIHSYLSPVLNDMDADRNEGEILVHPHDVKFKVKK